MNKKLSEEDLLHYFSELKCWIDVFMNKFKENLIRDIKKVLIENDRSKKSITYKKDSIRKTN